MIYVIFLAPSYSLIEDSIRDEDMLFSIRTLTLSPLPW